MEVLFGAADARSQHSRETKINIEQKRPIVDLAVKGREHAACPVWLWSSLVCGVLYTRHTSERSIVYRMDETRFCRKFCVNVAYAIIKCLQSLASGIRKMHVMCCLPLVLMLTVS